MPPRRPPGDRNYDDMVDANALHITPEQASTFGEPREALRISELMALRERASDAERLRQQVAELEDQIRAHAGVMTIQDGVIVVHDFKLTPKGLVAPESFSLETWQELGMLLFKLEGSIQWLIGDWIVYGDHVGWGDLPALAKALGRDYGTLRNYATISRRVQLSFRNDNLGYTHHVVVAGLTPEQQREALEYAAANELSVAKFRQWVAQQYGSKSQDTPLLTGEFKFSSLGRELDRYMRLNPAKARPEEKTDALAYAAQMQTWLNAFMKKWNES